MLGDETKYANISGILLEYIPGFPLTDLSAHAPKEAWQGICEYAIRIIHQISDRGILNEDVKTRSFIVCHDPEARGYRDVMTDFALCSFRREYEDDKVWREWIAREDEEGAIGFVMRRHLQGSPGGFVYTRSVRYMELDKEFKSEG